MKNTKTQKGITLVALIITIIVLLILAVVAIASVEESGIIKYAENAVTKYNEGKATEDSRLEEYEDFLAQHSNQENIKYYIFSDYLIQKIDFNANTCITILKEDSSCTIQGNSTILQKTSISEEVEIQLSDGTTKIITVGSSKADFKLGEEIMNDAMYIQGDKIYAKSGEVYYEYIQITNAEQIADIEEAIANVQQ